MLPTIENNHKNSKGPSFPQYKRVLIIRLDNIGDIVMLSPALRSLRAALPDAQITLMASPAGSQAAVLLPWINEVFTWRASWQDISKNPKQDNENEQQLIEKLRQGNYEAAFIFTSFTQSPYPPAYACYLAGIPVRIGQSREFGGAMLTHWFTPPQDEEHQVDRNLWLIEKMGYPVINRHLELNVPAELQASADQILDSFGIAPDETFVVAAPGASCSARRYDPRRFAAVIRQLTEAFGLKVVIAGSLKEAETLASIPETAGPRAVNLMGKTNVSELAGIIRRSSLVITNNSASMHISDAFRRPMVILYSGTERESQWEPRSSQKKLLRVETICSPCYHFECPFSMECLDISSMEVVQAVLQILPRMEVERSMLSVERPAYK